MQYCITAGYVFLFGIFYIVLFLLLFPTLSFNFVRPAVFFYEAKAFPLIPVVISVPL